MICVFCAGEYYHHSRSPKPLSGLKAAGGSPGATPATNATRLEVLSSGSAGLMATASDPRMLPAVGAVDVASSHRSAPQSTTPSATPEAVGPHAVTNGAAGAMKPQLLEAEPCCSDYDSSANGALSPQALGGAQRAVAVASAGSGGATANATWGSIATHPGTEAPPNAALLKEGVAAVSSYESHDTHACSQEPTHANTMHASVPSMPSTLHPCSVRDMETLQTTPPTSQGPLASNTYSSLNRHPSTLLTSTTSGSAAAHTTAPGLFNSGAGAGIDGGVGVGPSLSVLADAKEEQTHELETEDTRVSRILSAPLSMEDAYNTVVSTQSAQGGMDASHNSHDNKMQDDLPNEAQHCGRHKVRKQVAMGENDENSTATLQGTHSHPAQSQMQQHSMLLLQPEVGSVDDSESLVLTPNTGVEGQSKSGLKKTVSGVSSCNRHIFQRTSTVAEDALSELLSAQESVAAAAAVQAAPAASAVATGDSSSASSDVDNEHASSEGLDANMQPQETIVVSAAPSGAMTPIKGSQASDSASLQLPCVLPVATNGANRVAASPAVPPIEVTAQLPVKTADTATRAAAAEQDSAGAVAATAAAPSTAFETPEKQAAAQHMQQQQPGEIGSEKSPELLLGGFPDQAGGPGAQDVGPLRSSSDELRTELLGICAAATAAFKRVGKQQSALEAAAAVGRGTTTMYGDTEVEELAGYYLDAAASAAAVQKGVDLGAWAFDCTPFLCPFYTFLFKCSQTSAFTCIPQGA